MKMLLTPVSACRFYVAIITPVIHYCMGGLEIDVNSVVTNTKGKAIPGLYAAGEVAGGVHGNNRLGGNSLLDCVVFGRVAGKHAAEYMLGANAKPCSLFELSGGGLSGAVAASKNAGGSYEDGMNKSGGAAAAPAAGGTHPVGRHHPGQGPRLLRPRGRFHAGVGGGNHLPDGSRLGRPDRRVREWRWPVQPYGGIEDNVRRMRRPRGHKPPLPLPHNPSAALRVARPSGQHPADKCRLAATGAAVACGRFRGGRVSYLRCFR